MKRKRSYKLLIVIIVLIGTTTFLLFQKSNLSTPIVEEKVDTEEIYNTCMASDYETEEMIALEEQLHTTLTTNYSLSYLYHDISNNNKLIYDDGYNHYAASTIKVIPALYLYQEAELGNVNLEEKLSYMSTEKTIKEMIELSIEISDNASFLRLQEYITKEKLQEYASSLGATEGFTGYDQYGNINLEDGLIYLESLNEYFATDTELSNELYSFFQDSKFIYFQSSDAEQINKYGYYDKYFNELATIYEEYPYNVVLLTFEGEEGFETLGTEIHQHIYEFNQEYYQLKKAYCQQG